VNLSSFTTEATVNSPLNPVPVPRPTGFGSAELFQIINFDIIPNI